MPRCHIRCNVITDPEKSLKRRLHCTDIMPYLSCFFHVPVRVVYDVLGMSHHTMAPMRRQWNLSRWPFADICRGYFKLKGAYITWDDIEAKRKNMMVGADERIVKILEVMGQRALEHKHKVNMVVTRMRHEERFKLLESKLPLVLESNILPPVLPVLPPVLPCPQQPMKTEEEVFTESLPSGGDEEEDFFEGLIRLLEEDREPPPPHGELFTPLDE